MDDLLSQIFAQIRQRPLAVLNAPHDLQVEDHHGRAPCPAQLGQLPVVEASGLRVCAHLVGLASRIQHPP